MKYANIYPKPNHTFKTFLQKPKKKIEKQTNIINIKIVCTTVKISPTRLPQKRPRLDFKTPTFLARNTNLKNAH